MNVTKCHWKSQYVHCTTYPTSYCMSIVAYWATFNHIYSNLCKRLPNQATIYTSRHRLWLTHRKLASFRSAVLKKAIDIGADSEYFYEKLPKRDNIKLNKSNSNVHPQNDKVGNIYVNDNNPTCDWKIYVGFSEYSFSWTTIKVLMSQLDYKAIKKNRKLSHSGIRQRNEFIWNMTPSAKCSLMEKKKLMIIEPMFIEARKKNKLNAQRLCPFILLQPHIHSCLKWVNGYSLICETDGFIAIFQHKWCDSFCKLLHMYAR